MKTIFLFLLGCSMAMGAMAQSISYEYDAAGNRVKRITIPLIQHAPLKSLKVDSLLQEQQAVEEDLPPVKDFLGNRNVNIYPNPTRGQLMVQITGGDDDTQYRVRVISESGQSVFTQGFKGNGEMNVNLSDAPSGIYYLLLSAPELENRYKIIKITE